MAACKPETGRLKWACHSSFLLVSSRETGRWVGGQENRGLKHLVPGYRALALP